MSRLCSKEFQVRALTRNASSEAAQALVERGVEVVSADLAHKQSMLQAFSGAYGLFLMTEAGMDNPDEEIQLGKNAADAAKQAGIQHITKAEIKDYMQKLGLPLTTIYPGAFLENFFKYTVFMKQPDGTIFWSSNQSSDKKPWHSCRATGTAVQEALQDPDRCIGKTFAVKTEMVSAGKLSEMISQRIAENRRCRDVLFLLFFLGFWIGMVILAGFAWSKGNPKLLTHGVDQFGFVCGSKNTYNNATIDLTEQKYLYYLDPFALLNTSNLPWAASICVSACPGVADLCDVSSLPCRNNSQYRCPYYDLTPDIGSPTSTLSAETAGSDDTSYFSNLTSTTDTCAPSSVPARYSKYYSQFVTGSTASQRCGEYHQLTSQFPGAGPCYAVWAQTYPWFYRCVPTLPTQLAVDLYKEAGSYVSKAETQLTSLSSSLNNNEQRLRRYISDINRGKWIIIASGLGAGLVLSLIWMLVLRLFCGVMVWVTIWMANLCFIACTIFSYAKAGDVSTTSKLGHYIAEELPAGSAADPTAGDRKVWAIIAYVMTALTVLLFLFTLVMLRRIKIAVATLKVATQAIAHMPTLLLFPLVPFVLEVALVFWWVFVAAYLYSSGSIVTVYRSSSSTATYDPLDIAVALNFTTRAAAGGSPPPPSVSAPTAAVSVSSSTAAEVEECAYDPNCRYDLQWDKNMEYAFIYHFFGLLWTNQFIVGFGYVTVALAIAHYYWTRGNREVMPRFPVLHAIRTTLRYHLGSIALGSFIIAVIQFIRAMLEYVDRQMKAANPGNVVMIYLMACIKCFMWYVQKVMQFINRNAYIVVAVKGTGYCTSAGRAIKLIVNNALRLVAVNIMVDVVVWMGKIAVTAACGLLAFGLSDLTYYTDPVGHADTYLSSPLMPVLISVLVGYTISNLFLQVYEYAVNTILLSFCEDCEEHDGNAQFAPPLLIHALGQAQAHHDAEVAKANKGAVPLDTAPSSQFITS
ncbi:hypothetical protein WJX82_005374 [Trebouxia sp. C0006]